MREVAGRPAAEVSRPLPGALAVSQSSSAAMRCERAQSECGALYSRELHADVEKDGRAGGPRTGAAHRHIEYDDCEDEASAARRADQTGGEREDRDAPNLGHPGLIQDRAVGRPASHDTRAKLILSVMPRSAVGGFSPGRFTLKPVASCVKGSASLRPSRRT